MMIAVASRRQGRRNRRSGPVAAACFVLLLTTATTSLSPSDSIPPLPFACASIQDTSASSNSNECQTTIVSPGLMNLGNICYMNSQLECAFHIPLVRHLVLKEETSEVESAAGLISLRQVFTGLLASSSMVSKATRLESTASTAVSPRPLCQALQIPIWEQQDAQEFWKLLLPALRLPKLMDLYQGAYEEYIRALDGTRRERSREEAFLDLSLDLVMSESRDASDADILDSLVHMFRKPELLTVAEGNGWKPEKNAAPVDAEKGARLKEQGLPSVLQLHLKRFQYDWQTQTMTKVNTPWSFPLILDLYPLLVANENATEPCSAETALYDLQSVVLHVGDYESGHYYSYVRPDVTKHNCWYRFNDDQVERVDVRQVLQDAFGGARAINVDKGGEEMEDFAANTSNNIWSWWRRQLPWLFPTSAARSEHSFGYGGLTSNAYVLQYIRRRDIPLLYQPKKPDSCPGKSKL